MAKATEVLDGYLTQKELATELGICERTLIRWRALRQGPPFTKFGRSLRYRRISVMVWLQLQEKTSEKQNELRGDQSKIHPLLTGEQRRKREELLKAQDHKCAICRVNLAGGKEIPHLDHDHETGQLREMLCSRCNHGLGQLGDSHEVALKAAQYLAKHKFKIG